MMSGFILGSNQVYEALEVLEGVPEVHAAFY